MGTGTSPISPLSTIAPFDARCHAAAKILVQSSCHHGQISTFFSPATLSLMLRPSTAPRVQFCAQHPTTQPHLAAARHAALSTALVRSALPQRPTTPPHLAAARHAALSTALVCSALCPAALSLVPRLCAQLCGQRSTTPCSRTPQLTVHTLFLLGACLKPPQGRKAPSSCGPLQDRKAPTPLREWLP